MASARPKRWPRLRMTTREILLAGAGLALVHLLLLAAHLYMGTELRF